MQLFRFVYFNEKLRDNTYGTYYLYATVSQKLNILNVKLLHLLGVKNKIKI